MVKIFRRLGQGLSRNLEQAQHRKSGVRQSNPHDTQAGTLQIMSVFFPPAWNYELRPFFSRTAERALELE